MVDFILFCFYIAAFGAGIWCGNKYGNFKSIAKKLLEKLSN